MTTQHIQPTESVPVTTLRQRLQINCGCNAIFTAWAAVPERVAGPEEVPGEWDSPVARAGERVAAPEEARAEELTGAPGVTPDETLVLPLRTCRRAT